MKSVIAFPSRPCLSDSLSTDLTRKPQFSLMLYFKVRNVGYKQGMGNKEQKNVLSLMCRVLLIIIKSGEPKELTSP